MTDPATTERRDPVPGPYTGPEQRADWHTPQDCIKMVDVQQRLHDGAGRMERIEASIEELKAGQTAMKEKLDENSAATAESAAAIAEVLEIISTAKGFFKGASAIGSVLKWILGLATAALAFWFTLKSGRGDDL